MMRLQICPVTYKWLSSGYNTDRKEVKAVKEKVQEVLNKVRPFLQRDGGDVELVDVDANGLVKVRLKGACGGCPGATITLKQGIERVLKQEIPGVKQVIAV